MWRVKDPYLAPAPLRSVRKLVFKDEFEMASAGGWCAIGGDGGLRGGVSGFSN